MSDIANQYLDVAADSGATKRRAAILFVLITVALDAMAIGLVNPVLPRLVSTLGGKGIEQVGHHVAILGTLFFGFQLFSAPVQGALADTIGRRPVLLVSSLGMALDYLFMAFAPNMAFLYVARAISGLTAGNMAAAMVYMTDLTPQFARARVFALGGAAFYFGASVGPLLGGSAAAWGARAPFLISAGICLVNTLYGALVVRESLAQTHRRPFSLKALNPLAAVKTLLRAHPHSLRWSAPVFLTMLVMMGVNAIGSVYMTFRFEFTPQQIGFYFAGCAVGAIFVQGAVLPVVTRWLDDRALMIWGAICATVAMIGMAASSAAWGFVAATGLWLVGSFASISGAYSVLTSLMGPADQGKLQGAARSLESLAGLLAPAPFAYLLGRHWAGLQGWPYITAAVLTASASLTFWWLRRDAVTLEDLPLDELKPDLR